MGAAVHLQHCPGIFGRNLYHKLYQSKSKHSDNIRILEQRRLEVVGFCLCLCYPRQQAPGGSTAFAGNCCGRPFYVGSNRHCHLKPNRWILRVDLKRTSMVHGYRDSQPAFESGRQPFSDRANLVQLGSSHGILDVQRSVLVSSEPQQFHTKLVLEHNGTN